VKRIAVLTSGGDCSGMNGAIRAVVRTGLAAGLEVIGVQKGYSGLLERQFQPMESHSVSNILQRGGTFLQTARCKEMHTDAGQELAAANLRAAGVEGLVVIGGGGSLTGALALARKGVPVIGLPASIDNDIAHTDMSLGVDTALNNIIYAVDCVKDTASSHDRAFIIETMGRNCGYLCVVAAIACGAEFAIIPESPYDIGQICQALQQRYREGRSNSLILVAEGAATAQQVADQIKDKAGYETRIVVLGHYQRGGTPSVFDRLLGARFGVRAVEALLAGERGKMVGLRHAGLMLTELEQVVTAGVRPIDASMLKLADSLVI